VTYPLSPRPSGRKDLMCRRPDPVDEKQLRELHIRPAQERNREDRLTATAQRRKGNAK